MKLMNPDDGPQLMPGQSRNVTYVSRLQSMQAAVDSQLEEMNKEQPDKRVALVAFNSEVSFIYEDYM